MVDPVGSWMGIGSASELTPRPGGMGGTRAPSFLTARCANRCSRRPTPTNQANASCSRPSSVRNLRSLRQPEALETPMRFA